MVKQVQISQFLCEMVCFCPPLHSFSLYLLFPFVHMMECSLPLDLLHHLTKELNQRFSGGCHRNNFCVLPSQNYWVSGRKSNGIIQGIVIATMDFFFPLLSFLTSRTSPAECILLQRPCLPKFQVICHLKLLRLPQYFMGRDKNFCKTIHLVSDIYLTRIGITLKT